MANHNQNSYGDQEKNTWVCPDCETINSGDSCYVCGRPLIIEEKKVCSCGHQNSMNAKFCSECGRKLSNNEKWKKILFVAVLALSLCALIAVLFKPHTHDWKAATCTDPKTCMTCGETTGSKAAHQWEAATCTVARTCKVCGKTSGTALGHQWKDATYYAPKTCTVCGKTTGTKLEKPVSTEPTTPRGYISRVSGQWEQVTLRDGYSTYNISAYVFYDELVLCEKMTIDMNVSMKAGTKCKEWQVWGRVDGKFKKIAKISLPAGDGSVSQVIQFENPLSIDAIAVTPTVPGGYSWSMGLSITDVYVKD